MSMLDGAILRDRDTGCPAGSDRKKIHLVRAHPVREIPSHWTANSPAALLKWLEGVGVELTDLTIGMEDVPVTDYPRSEAWRDLPVVRRPAFSRKHGSISGTMRSDGTISTHRYRDPLHPSPMMQGAGAILVDVPDLSPESLMPAVGLNYDAILNDGVEVNWFDGEDVRPVSTEAILASKAARTVTLHLGFNLSWNLSVFIGRAARRVCHDERLTSKDLAAICWAARHASTPVGIQILFDLESDQETAPVRLGASEEDWLLEYAGKEAVRLAVSRWQGRFGSGDGDSVVWHGTGRYGSLRMPFLRKDQVSRLEHLAPCALDAVERYVLSGLIGLTADGKLAITRMGRLVLGVLGHSLRDPDLPLRWRGRGLDAISEVDRWLNHALRRTKRRVSSLKEAPYRELPIEQIPFHGRRNMMVYGGSVRLDPAHERSDRQQGIVAWIERYESRIPFAERVMGLCRPRNPQVDRDTATGVWFGVPLGILEDREAYDLDPVDPKSLAPAIIRAGLYLDDLFSSHGGQAADQGFYERLIPSKFMVGMTNEPENRVAEMVSGDRPISYL